VEIVPKRLAVGLEEGLQNLLQFSQNRAFHDDFNFITGVAVVEKSGSGKVTALDEP
jgi:hypothetical protein